MVKVTTVVRSASASSSQEILLFVCNDCNEKFEGIVGTTCPTCHSGDTRVRGPIPR